MQFDLRASAREKRLIVAHRGVCGGNIPCNTIAAYEIALRQGADMIEIDVDMSADGKLFIFHPGMESAHLNQDCNIARMTEAEVRALRFVNGNGRLVEHHERGTVLVGLLFQEWIVQRYIFARGKELLEQRGFAGLPGAGHEHRFIGLHRLQQAGFNAALDIVHNAPHGQFGFTFYICQYYSARKDCYASLRQNFTKSGARGFVRIRRKCPQNAAFFLAKTRICSYNIGVYGEG